MAPFLYEDGFSVGLLTYTPGGTVSNPVSPRERLRRSTTGAAASVRTARVPVRWSRVVNLPIPSAAEGALIARAVTPCPASRRPQSQQFMSVPDTCAGFVLKV
ncbi:hypothetical protein FCJ60_18900 [Burkholderia metallica]|nr:hypothetical protein [Burkholderia metallica]